MKSKISIFLILIQFLIFAGEIKNDNTNLAPKVFFDCERLDYNYVRENITFINYVIERKKADIFIMGTRQRTGSGGRKYIFNFIGQNQFAGVNDILSFAVIDNETSDVIRMKMVKILKLGLIPYISKTAIAKDIEITYTKSEEAVKLTDKWNNWVFKTRLNTRFRGEEFSSDTDLGTEFSADRITEKWKIQTSIDYHYSKEYEELEDENVTAIKKDLDIDGLIVKSLSEHWSLGAGFLATSATYSNIEYNYNMYPAIEWNIFPYSEANLRQFCFRYGVGYRYSNYRDTTIYNKIEESLLGQSLTVDLEFKQTWGEIDVNIEGFNYFHDLKKNHLRIRNRISLYLFKGLSFSINSGASLIHDQISLPKEEISDIERLMNIKEIKTNYSYWFGVGLEYTFGFIYNNIVNQRF